ncbi:hypothetical protein [Agrobacterium tumefaciens]|uniref:hypothetical protein n=1 Tax=Agrobacterium tumefaciens TaxID=358 RepID=UPI0015747527|nr:hypothetical protein [Agrobacterium tumefaciens]NTA45928.1 hypothetical protein [Agrobacterium tumefaciens]WCK17096.1 hypothetical protein G6L41_025520 [Agrobacterium tumefaciens]WIE36454.1 hypothetical protein G6L82_026285 [Agrobacterium tumefaciens]
MTSLIERLAAANIRRVLIVDDVFDPVPLSADLALDDQAWTSFFDDALAEDQTVLQELFPAYEETEANELATSNEFVALLWNNRARFRDEHIGPVFERYISDMARDAEYAAGLRAQLEALGLECSEAGRDFEGMAAPADLIIIDLFLGSQQDNGAIDLSKSVLKKVVQARPAQPPLVLLMSRSSRLNQKREEFRDQTGLLQSGFRVVQKSDLAQPERLQAILSRFELHKLDFDRLALFLDQWQRGAHAAVDRTAAQMRQLDLSDIGQIRHLLLAAEQEATGNYIVDVFDRVLQHEVESEAGLIDSAIALNEVTSDQYPPPHLSGSLELQKLVFKTLFQHTERLKLSASEGSNVSFGDVLRLNEGVALENVPFQDLDRTQVLAVLTPACDLQRKGAKRILLLTGTLKALGPADWKYDDAHTKTAVIELDSTRFWVQWDLKFVETISHDKLDAAFETGRLSIVGRLREVHALELQQKLLSNLGRIGLPAVMPAAFPINVEVCFTGADKKPTPLVVPGLDAGGVCYVGRSGSVLVLTEPVCDNIQAALKNLNLELVNEASRPAFDRLRQTDDLAVILSKGLTLPNPTAQNLQSIKSPSVTEGNGLVVGFVARNRGDNQAVSNGDLAKAGIIILTRDLPKD